MKLQSVLLFGKWHISSMQDTAKLNELKHRASVNGDKEKGDKLKRLCQGCSISYYLLTEDEVITGKYQTEISL